MSFAEARLDLRDVGAGEGEEQSAWKEYRLRETWAQGGGGGGGGGGEGG